MAKKKARFINETHIEGYIYEHDLKLKVTGENSKHPGTPFINGSLSIAVDDDCLNVIKVYYTYVTPTYGSTGKENANFATLKNIIEGNLKSVMEHGKENAHMVRVDGALALHDWYDLKSSGEPLISTKRNEGKFIHQTNALNEKPEQRATFKADMLIVGATRLEADEERNLPERMTLRGYIFNWSESILPVEFSVRNPRAMDYFESYDPSNTNPLYTTVAGEQVSLTVVRTQTEESAFGEPIVKETTSSYRDFVINWAASEPHAWDEEGSLMASEVVEMLQAREIYLANEKQRNKDFQASKQNAGNAFAAASSSAFASSPSGSVYEF
jgi:hypothetical protein